jgi:nicotinamide mononucleotide transporter PnuC
MKKLGITKKELFIDYLPTLLTGIVMIGFAIIKEQTFFKTLPTLISLVVMLMSARANRFSFLLGASNCILYTISYFDQKIYFSAASALLVSLPIQIFSFFLWQKHKTGKTQSKLVRMKAWQIALAVVAVLVAWAGCYFGLARFFNGTSAELDTLLFVLGILVSVLVALRFVEGQYFNIISCLVSLGMWTTICMKSPENINYLIIAAYNLFRVVQAAVNWGRLSKGDAR